MLRHIRKIATGLLAVALALSPTLSAAAQYQYFRMYGHGGLIALPPGGAPQGDLSYQISGASAATVGQPYVATSSVAGAVGATVFFVQSGPLAPGLSLDTATGTLSGTPTTAGSYPVVLGVRDSLNSQGFAALNLTTNAAVAISGSPSVIGTVGTAYAAQFAASGGSAPYVFSTTSALPPGLSLSQNGLLAGVPSLAGDYQNIMVHAADAAGGSADSTAFAIKIAKPLAVAWGPASGQVGVAYVASLPQTTGGSEPYLYSLNGQAPNGLTFNNATGAFAGTPAIAGSYSVGVTVVDADGRLAQSGARSLVIAPGQVVDPAGPLALAGSPPATAQIGIGYIAHFTASGGSQAGYVFDLAAGVLPSGLSLNHDNGTISGAPNVLGTYSGIQVRVTDSTAETALSGLFTITVAPQPALIISGNPSSSAQVGSSYQADFAAFDGTGAGYTFTSIGSALPPGLALSNVGGASGSLIGTPTFVGTYSGLQIRVTDSGGHTADSQTFSITVAPRAGTSNVVIAGSPQRWADIGTPYSAGFSASGGTGSYTFTASGNVPLGLSMSPDGILSGTPTAAGADLFTVQVVDSEGDAASASFTITVAQPLDLTVGSLPYGFKNAGYSYQLTAFGGTQPFSYVQSGLLPPGVALNASTGLISGTPSTGGGLTYGGIISVVDALGRTIARNATMTVYDPLTVFFQPPSGAVGEPYLATPAVAGGAGGYVFSIKAFPSGGSVNLGAFGLTMDPTTGAISGVPTTAGITPEFNYIVTDKVGLLAAAPSPDGGFHTSIFIAGALSVAGSPSQVATVGQPYSASFSTVGGTGSPTFAIASGVLPGWLTLNPTTGVLAGTPQAGDIGAVGPLTVSVVDQGQGRANSTPFTISVAMSPVLSGAPATATLGSAYSFDLATLTTGGRAPYSYVVTTGALPAGMSIADTTVATSQVTGQTATAGITVTDADGRSAFGSLTFVVAAATANASLSSPAEARSGAALAGTLSTNLPGATWSFSQTPSSPSLGLSASNAGFSGTAPSVASVTSYSITATATEGSNFVTSAPMALTVAPVLAVSGGPSSDVAGDVGLAIAATPAASVGSSGIGTISYVLLQGGSAVTLSNSCPGLLFSTSTAVVSGTPSATCSLSGLTIRATDAADGANATTALPFSIAVSSGISAPSGSFATTATAGTNYSSGPLTITGGTAPQTWSIASGSLPSGLSLDPATGVLSGVPTTTGAFTFTVKRTDSLGQLSPASSAQNVTVAAATFAAAPSSQAIHVGQPISGTFSSSFSAPTISVVQSPATPDLALTATASSWSGTAPMVATQTVFSVTWTGKTAGGAYSKAAPVTAVNVYPALALAAVSNFTSEAGNSVSFMPPALSNLIGSATWTLLQNGSPVSISSLCGSMTFDSTTGQISSANAAACSPTNLTYRVSDSADGTSVTSSSFSITIGAAQAAPTGSLISSAVAGVSYSSGPLTTNGGTGPFTWSLATGSLPSGLSLNSSTGVVSGTPNANGSYNFTLQVTDIYSVASPASAKQTVTVTQTPSNNGTYTTAAQVGTPYSKTAPSTTGGPGTPPYSYHLFTGTIPPGLTLNSDGSLTGTPTTAGAYTFQVYLTDANNVSSASAGTSTTIAVSGATVSGTLNTPTTVRSGASFSGTLNTSRASPTWTMASTPSSPSLGLTVSGNTSSATFTGTAPTVAAQQTFSLQATAASGGSSSNTATFANLTVNPTLSISGGSSGTVTAEVGSALTATSAPSVSGLVGTGTYALLQNGLPIALSSSCPGLSFSSSTGVISGTPTASCGIANLTLQVTDSIDSVAAATSSSFGITVSTALGAPTGSFAAAGTVGSGYSSGPLSVSGGASPYTWSVASGTIPTGLTLDPSSGSLSGTPTAASAYTFTVKATDSLGHVSAASASQTVTISAATGSIALTTPANSGSVHGGKTVSGTLTTSLPNPTWTFSISPATSPPLVLTPSGNTSSATFSGTAPVTPNGTLQYHYVITATASSGSFSTTTSSVNFYDVEPLVLTGGPPGTVGGDVGAAITSTAAIGYRDTANIAAQPTLALMQGGSAVSLGTLCPGLSFSATNGVISGAPTTTCSQSGLTILATDSDGSIASTSAFAISIQTAPTAPTGTLTSSGIAGVAYSSGPLTPHGGTSPLTWSVASGALPSGLSLNSSTGVVSGTPNAQGTYNFTLKVTDAVGVASPASATQTVAITQTPSNNGTYTTTAQVGSTYSKTAPTTSGGPGTPPYAYHLFTGTIPPGLTLNSDGSLTGTPTTAGSYTFQVYLTDANNVSSASAGTSTTITVSAATASISASSTYRAGDTISGTASSSLTSPTWTFSQTPTTPSLSLSASGSTLSGVAPTVASQTTYSVSATATSGSSTVNASTISIKVNPTLSLSGGPSGTLASAVNAAMTTTSAPTPSGVVGTASYTLLKSNVAYSTLSTDCPGLSLSSSSGQISGTPTASCTVSGLQIQITDSSDGRTAKGANTFALSISGTPVVIDSSHVPPIEAVGETNYVWSASASGGTGPYSFSFTGGTGSGSTGSISGSAWNGISFSTVGINNTGQPTQAGTLTNFTAVATDSRGVTSAPVQFTLTVNAALQWSGSWPTSCVVGQTCSASFTATGGQANYNYSGGKGYFFSSTGAAIAGLQIVSGVDGAPVVATTGAVGAGPAVFSFVPSAVGTLSGTFAQVNTFGTAKGVVSNISVVGATASASLTSSNVRQGGAISGTLTSNYTSPTWSFAYSPTTPAFTLTPAGSAFSGTAPSVASQTTFSITAKATAATGGGSVSASAMSLKVYPAVSISGGPSGTVSGTSGTAITATAAPTTSNLIGTPTYSLLQSGSAITLSSVCAGLSFSTTTGVISGTPTAACSTGSTLTIRITDGFDSTTATTSAAFAVTVTSGTPAPSEGLILSVTSGAGIVSSGTMQSATQSTDGAWMKVNPSSPLVIQYSQPVAATGVNLSFYCPLGFDGTTGLTYSIDSSNDGTTWTTRASGSYDYPNSGCPSAVAANGLGIFSPAAATYWRFVNTSGTYSTVDQFRPK